MPCCCKNLNLLPTVNFIVKWTTIKVRNVFIFLRCPNDITVRYLAPPSVSVQRFSLEAFESIASNSFVFVHCHVIVCNATDPGSKCTKKCPSSGRGRREVHESDHKDKNVYSMALGPLHLTREKLGEKSGSSLETSGMYKKFWVLK